MGKFLIFKSEVEDGLESKISANTSISSTCEVEVCAPFTFKSELRSVAENKDQLDLHYLKSILVSTGWNKNDDFFDQEEVWNARKTPEDKPFNYEHDQNKIIGHITECHVVDDNSQSIEDTALVSNLPEKFHILTSAVLYKYWEDPVKQLEVNVIINEILENKWFVSMEAIFDNFDYAMVEGERLRVVSRNESTAFLTKYLRAYGGSGSYNNAKIGRVLRNIIFSGKGLVRKPANPESIILNDLNNSSAGLVYSLDEATKLKEKPMTDNEAELNQKISVLEAQAVKLTEDNIVANSKAKAHEEEAKQLTAEISQLKITSEKVISELNQIKEEKKSSDRVNYISEKFGVDSVEASKLAESFAILNDESFTAAIIMQSEYLNKKLDQYKSEKVKRDEEETAEAKKDKKSKKEEFLEMINKKDKDKEEDKEGESKANLSVLETVEVKSDLALATSENIAGVKEVALQIASYFGVETSKESV